MVVVYFYKKAGEMVLFSTNDRINIVITNNVLRYTQHKTPTKDGLITHGEIELPPNTMQDGVILNRAVLLETINKLIHQHKWKRKKLFFALPDSTVVIRELTIPEALAKEEALGYLYTQIGVSLYLPYENPVLEIEFLDADEEGRNILLFAYPKDKILSLEKVFTEAGLKPVVADLTSLSVYRYYYKTRLEGVEHNLLIHWNDDALTLTAFYQDKAIFTRHIKTVQLEDERSNEQLVSDYMMEINRIIEFYQYSIMQGQSRIEQILLTGDFQGISLVEQAIQNEINIPLYPFEEDVKYIDALGLALKQEV